MSRACKNRQAIHRASSARYSRVVPTQWQAALHRCHRRLSIRAALESGSRRSRSRRPPTTPVAPRRRSSSPFGCAVAYGIGPSWLEECYMSKFIWMHGALALAMFIPFPAWAASDADLAEIREQIRQLKESYEARIQALEQRLKDAESRGAASPVAQPAAAPAPLAAAAAPAAAPASGISAFNPAISAVLQGTYGNFSQDPNKYALSGFAPSGDIAPGKRGLSLGESELAISASVDDKFYGNLIVSLTPENTLSVEEAYGLYTGAGYGLAPKFGRFFSSLGYMNDQHQHAWDFVDAPLVYQAFLGGQYDVDGLQLKWLAPTDEFLEFGGELGSGEGFPGTSRNKN